MGMSFHSCVYNALNIAKQQKETDTFQPVGFLGVEEGEEVLLRLLGRKLFDELAKLTEARAVHHS